jgi:hypothetical protein
MKDIVYFDKIINCGSTGSQVAFICVSKERLADLGQFREATKVHDSFWFCTL